MSTERSIYVLQRQSHYDKYVNVVDTSVDASMDEIMQLMLMMSMLIIMIIMLILMLIMIIQMIPIAMHVMHGSTLVSQYCFLIR